ncbi:MAG: hypothetical protein ACE5GB_10980 [Acidimicrobiales bacterium]
MTSAETTVDIVLTDESVERTFSISILISAVRCTLTYVIFPWILPLLGIAGGVGPGIGLVIGTVAIVANAFTIRRFWAARHRYRVPVTVLSAGIIVLLVVLVVVDLADLFS